MPNWCFNFITVKGDVKEVNKYREALHATPAQYQGEQCSDVKKITMNGIIPVPKHILEGPYYDNNLSMEEALGMLYGKIEPTDGYHWQIANWGTKWDFGDVDINEYYDKDGDCHVMTMSTETAWAPVVPFIKSSSKKFPELRFKIEYEELGCMIAGFYEFVNGDCLRSVTTDESFESLVNYYIAVQKSDLQELFHSFVYDEDCENEYNTIVDAWLSFHPEDKGSIPAFKDIF